MEEENTQLHLAIPFTYKYRDKLLDELEKKNYTVLDSLIIPAEDPYNNKGLDFIFLDISQDIIEDKEFIKAIRKATKTEDGSIDLAFVQATEKRYYDPTSFYFVYTKELITLTEEDIIKTTILDQKYSETFEN